MRVLVIGGTGHIGSYLVPRLVLAGHQVAVVARHPAPQYTDARLAWGAVEWIVADRKAEEQAGTWARRMADLEADAVIDLIAFTPKQNRAMVQAFEGRVEQFLHCGTIWAYGPTERAPYEEHFPRRPTTQYGIDKAQIEAELLAAWRERGFPATIVHPGHISGRRWLPIDPQGSRDGVGVYRRLARGESVHLPDLGLATLHHVHGDDVAALFQTCLEQREAAVGEAFSAVAPYALSLLGCCRFVASLFGREPALEYVPLADLATHVGDESFAIIESHVVHSPCSSIAKQERVLGHRPRYTTEQIYAESIEYLLESGQLEI
jgi:nucleoside-diphosphate-sugar epimerase